MSLAFAAPLALLGLGLLILPWIIHHIRRPEREPLHFSSLMFLPKAPREVIERRRHQHLLLMLLRMLALAALALAFARPLWRTPLRPGGAGVPAFRAIVLDVSLSMRAADVWPRAQAAAREEIARAGADDRFCVVLFGSRPRVVAPFRRGDDPRAGTAAAAREAVDQATPTEQATEFIPALRAAQEQLLAAAGERPENETHLVLRFVSDLQKAGLPAKPAGWRLSPRIDLQVADVGLDGLDGVANLSVTELAQRRLSDGQIRLQAKVKNWSTAEIAGAKTSLILGGETRETRPLSLKAGAATQIAFTLGPPPDKPVEGRIELSGDAFDADNRRHFVFSPSTRRRVWIVETPKPEARWPASFFFQKALAAGEGWDLEVLTPAEMANRLAREGGEADVLALLGAGDFPPAASEAVIHWIRDGGSSLIALAPRGSKEDANALIEPLGLRSSGAQYGDAARKHFDLLAWVDFSSPLFSPLSGARYSDFSQVYIHDRQKLEVNEGAKEPPKILARIEADELGVERPAIISSKLGKGRALVWAFNLDLESSTLPKSVKYVPLMRESLSWLVGSRGASPDLIVGDRWEGPPPRVKGEGAIKWIFQSPGAEPLPWGSDGFVGGAPTLANSGVAGWKGGGSKDWVLAEAVNAAPAESNLARLGVEEFRALAAQPTAPEVSPDAAGVAQAERGYSIRAEFWRALLAGLFLVLVLESWYAFRVLR